MFEFLKGIFGTIVLLVVVGGLLYGGACLAYKLGRR